MQSVDEFTPSTTEPVFGSGLISQTKSQSSTNNDINDHEKVIPPSEPVVNGQNDSTVNKITSNDNITNGTTENSSGAGDSTAVHVNGQSEKPIVEINNDVKPVEETVSATEKPTAHPEPVSSTPVDTVNEGSSTPMDTAPPPVAEPTTAAANDTVPEASVAAESETAEVKTKPSRGKAKAPVVTPTPTRQSTRGRKPASSSNVDENQTTDDTGATNSNEPSQRTKRQAATVAKDAIAAINQPNLIDDVNNQDIIPTVGDEDAAITGDEKVSPSAGKKRGAAKTTPNAAKKPKGKTSVTSTSDVDTEPTPNEVEIVQTPPKKARTSATKKTPEPVSEEYARKLRPRK
jgi:hypothetical protein